MNIKKLPLTCILLSSLIIGCDSTKVIPSDNSGGAADPSPSSTISENSRKAFLKDIEDFAQDNNATTRNRSDDQLVEAGRNSCKKIARVGVPRSYEAIKKMNVFNEGMNSTHTSVTENSFKMSVKHFCPKYTKKLDEYLASN